MVFFLSRKFKKLSSLIDQGLTSGGNFLTIAVCANYLSLNEQGKLGYVYAFYFGVVFLNLSSIFQWASVNAPRVPEKIKYFRNLCLFQLFSVVVSSLFIFFVFVVFERQIDWDITALELLLLLVFLFVQQFADFDRRASYIFRSSERAAFSSCLTFLPRIIFLVFLQPTTIVEVLCIMIAASIFSSLLGLRVLFSGRMSGLFDGIAQIKNHLHSSRNLIAVAPLSWLWTFIPVFVLGIIEGSAAVAVITAVRSLANVVNVLMEQMETVVAAKLGHFAHSTDYRELKKAYLRLLLFGLSVWLIGMAVVVTCGVEILTTVLGTKYSGYQNVLSLLWLSYGVFFVARAYGMKYRFMQNTRVELIGNLLSVVVLALISYPVVVWFGIAGAASLLIVSSLTILLSQIVFVRLSGKSGTVT